jgi:hypothetical protein
MKRTLLVLAIVAAISWPLLVSSNDSRSGQLRFWRNKTVRVADSGSSASSSANYSVPSESINSGGAPVQSASYSVYASAIGEFGAGSSASADYYTEIGDGFSGLEGPMTAISRKTHGTAGIFDIDLPFSGPVGIECRNVGALPGGATGDYQLVVTFAEPVMVSSASVTSGTGTVPPGGTSVSGNQITVDLTGVANAQYITVNLNNVADSQNNAVTVSSTMGVLLGDTTANGAVNSSDIAQTQSKSGQPVTANNFREDVTVNGAINSSDIGLVQSKSGTALPSSP